MVRAVTEKMPHMDAGSSPASRATRRDDASKVRLHFFHGIRF